VFDARRSWIEVARRGTGTIEAHAGVWS